MSRTRRRLQAVGITAAMAAALVIPAAATAAASGGVTLYVDGISSVCTDSGGGTQSAPFCSLQAAVNAAAAGDMVSVTGYPELSQGNYGAATISNSGTAAAPITIVATGSTYASLTSLTVDGSYIDITGLEPTSQQGPAVTVDGSHVTFDHDSAYAADAPAVDFGPDVSDVTVEQSFLTSDFVTLGTVSTPVVQADGGTDGLVLTTDEIGTAAGQSRSSSVPLVNLSGSHHTDITSDTFVSGCDSAVGVTSSTGTTIENDVVTGYPTDCAADGPADLSVDTASAPTTTADYNELSQMGVGVAPYTWGGSVYQTQSAFNAATGQGAHDEIESHIATPGTTAEPTGAGVADGNASAPGELTTDLYGNAWPGAAPDRGAVAVEEYTAATLSTSTITAQDIGITLDLEGVAWGQSSTFSVAWGDGKSDSGMPFGNAVLPDYSDQLDTHNYAQPGTYTITVTVADPAQTVTRTATVTTTGSTFVPVTPTRILDTRDGTGAPAGMVGPGATLAIAVTHAVPNAPSGTITAVVMNVTTTNATAPGFVTVYPDGTALPNSSNVNYAKNETVPNLVTLEVGADGKVDLHNTSSGGTDLIADVEGYYVQGTAGSLYLANAPQRLLDTRDGTGAPAAAVKPGATVSLTIPGCPAATGTTTVPATAIAMNVTATDPTAAGFLTVYPDGMTLPDSSNLNYAKNQTVPNLVVVEVGSDGKVDFHNTSTGTVEIVGDLEGCYTATTGAAFVPMAPTRELDTRTGLGEDSSTGIPVPADGVAPWNPVAPLNEMDGLTAMVLNVTVTEPKANGFITAYPLGDPNAAPPNASNLNFAAGETVPNLVMVATTPLPGAYLRNTSKGTTELVVDLFGYFS